MDRVGSSFCGHLLVVFVLFFLLCLSGFVFVFAPGVSFGRGRVVFFFFFFCRRHAMFRVNYVDWRARRTFGTDEETYVRACEKVRGEFSGGL